LDFGSGLWSKYKKRALQLKFLKITEAAGSAFPFPHCITLPAAASLYVLVIFPKSLDL
jgi:hypothetical protein